MVPAEKHFAVWLALCPQTCEKARADQSGVTDVLAKSGPIVHAAEVLARVEAVDHSAAVDVEGFEDLQDGIDGYAVGFGPRDYC